MKKRWLSGWHKSQLTLDFYSLYLDMLDKTKKLTREYFDYSVSLEYILEFLDNKKVEKSDFSEVSLFGGLQYEDPYIYVEYPELRTKEELLEIERQEKKLENERLRKKETEKKKKQVLSKLTAEERTILGL